MFHLSTTEISESIEWADTHEQNLLFSFMLVLASNEPEQFDWAVNDRLDEMVQFTLPSLDERRRMTYLYFDTYILRSAERRRFVSFRSVLLYVDLNFSSSPIKLGAFGLEKKCEYLAEKTDGFSGREIAKLLAACQVRFAILLVFTLMNKWKLVFCFQASAYASEDATLTEEMIEKKLRDALESHKKKVAWRAEEER